MSDILDGLAFGEVALKPIERPAGYMLLKRLDPATLPAEPRQFEVPTPSDPDYALLAASAGKEQLVAVARGFVGALGTKALLDGKATAKVTEVIGKLVAYVEQNEANSMVTVSTLRATLASLEATLGKRDFDKLETFGRHWLVSQLMPPGSVAGPGN